MTVYYIHRKTKSWKPFFPSLTRVAFAQCEYMYPIKFWDFQWGQMITFLAVIQNHHLLKMKITKQFHFSKNSFTSVWPVPNHPSSKNLLSREMFTKAQIVPTQPSRKWGYGKGKSLCSLINNNPWTVFYLDQR